MLRLAIDIGGTFTDVAAETPEGLCSIKVLTNGERPEVAALEGVEQVLGMLSKTHADISDVVHGTTLATNALIERRGAKIALVTTAGFRDVLEMRYEKRFEQHALDIQMPEPLVPRSLRLGLKERILADGSVYQAPSDDEIDVLAHTLSVEGVEAVAIGFLHSYKNSTHEDHVAKRLRQYLGNDVTVCLSSDVASEIREYERFSTVCANAYVRPLIARYLGRLRGSLREKGFDGSFLMMLSDGALTTVEQAARYPIRLVEGGPAGGVALAAHVARETGSDRTLSLDIGGTTAKICFIENGTPQTKRRFEVARAWREVKGSGLPIKIPAVELVEIGAGGGSIATIDGLRRLKVGPKSAGSEPGPAAYNRGGDQATITDAHLTVGNIASEGFAGGMITLEPTRAHKAVRAHIQTPLEMEAVEPAAAGVIELADETMANAARVHGIELGLDISAFDLLVSGGGGGLHGARIAEKLGIRRVIVPQNAGVGSAVGFLRSPVAFESAISVEEVLIEIDFEGLRARIEATLAEVRSIVDDAAPDAEIDCAVKAEMRYRGQGLEIPLLLDLEAGDIFTDLQDRFEERFRQRIGFTLKEIPVELISVGISAREQRVTQRATAPTGPRGEAQLSTRSVYDLSSGDTLEYTVSERASMNGRALTGPAIITEAQTTTLVRPGWSVHQSPNGHLILERGTS